MFYIFKFYSNQKPVRFTARMFAGIVSFPVVLLLLPCPRVFAAAGPEGEKAGGRDESGKEKPPATWRCEPAPVLDSADASSEKTIETGVGIRSARRLSGLQQDAGKDMEDLSDTWEFSFHFGVSTGYEIAWFHLVGPDLTLNVMPVLEIRKFRPMGSSLKTYDKVMRFGLRMDFHHVWGCLVCDEEGESPETRMFMVGPEVGYRMYWPGKNQKRPVSLLHGPFAGLQLMVTKYGESDDYRDPERKTHDLFVHLRLGYEFGMLLLQRFQISMYIGYARIIAGVYGINIAYVH